MDLNDHILHLQSFHRGEGLREDALRVSNDALAVRQSTILEEGRGVNGPFSDYTDAYADTRQSEGYQVGYKDYNKTGRLAQSITPEVVVDRPGLVIVEITSRTEDGRNKLRGASLKDGNILDLPQDEIDLVQNSFRQARLKRINQ